MYSTQMTSATSATFAGLFYILICCFYFFLIGLGIALLIFMLLMLIDVAKRGNNEFGENGGKDSKTLWILLILLTNPVGTFIYYFMIFRKYPRKVL